jgi:hypothetical protein
VSIRSGLWDGRLISLFPRKLTNSARSATVLQGMDYATRILNIVPNKSKAGSGRQRYGLGAKVDAIAGEDILEVMEYRRSDGSIQLLVYTDAGRIYTLNETTGAYTMVKSGLDNDGTLFWQAFNGKLVVVNGVDANMAWNGSAFVDLGEYVTDYDADNDVFLGSSPTWVDNNTFTIVRSGGNDKYPNGRSIRVTFETAGAVIAAIASTSYNSGTSTLTVNVVGTPFPGSSQVIKRVEYYDQPPPFSYIFAEHDILFALSEGKLKPKTYRGTDSLKVFYTDSPNNENAWFNQSGTNPTQEVPFFNIENKARIFDELLAIRSVDGNMAFMGRNQLYLYAGTDPSDPQNWAWLKTIPVGIVHPKLVQDFPSDVLFFTSYGARSLRRVFETQNLQISADLGSDIEGDVADKVAILTTSETSYRKARSFFYDRDGYYGFKLDDIDMPVYVINEDARGWVFFSGIFSNAQAFLGTTDGRLIVGRGGQLYAYANGSDAEAGISYNDDGVAFDCIWESPWIQLGNNRWSNRGWEIIMEEAQTGTMQIQRFINTNDRNSVTVEFSVTVTGTTWDESEWDVDTWDGDVINPISSDRFLCDDFRFRFGISELGGPFSVLGINPIGR